VVGQAGTLDLFPTIVELASLRSSLPTGLVLDGRSLVPMLTQGERILGVCRAIVDFAADADALQVLPVFMSAV
jgi:hypothetical protein